MQFDQLSSEGGSAPASPSTRLEKWRNLSQDLDAFVSGLLADRSSSLTDSKKKGGDGRSFIVVIVQGVVGQFDSVFSNAGETGGAKAASALRTHIDSNLDDIVLEEHANAIYIIANKSVLSEQKIAHVSDFLSGFNEAEPLASCLFLESAQAASNKAKALIDLHGSNPRCLAIVLDTTSRMLTKELAAAVLDKVYYFDVSELPHPTRFKTTPAPLSRLLRSKAPQKVEGSRTINPDLLIYKQEPRICDTKLFLPTGCPHGEQCHFAHDYALTGPQLADLKVAVQRLPCESAKESADGVCPFGPTCLYGHVCPFGERCTFGTNCRFGPQAHPANLARGLKSATKSESWRKKK